MTTGARISIGGTVVPSGWDGSNVVAADGLSIEWGRSGPYDDPEPSILTMTLVDRPGTFINDLGRIGQPVVVEMLDPARVVFRGTLAKPRAQRRRVYNPLTDADETVWTVTLTAVDPLASMAQAVFPGDARDGWVEGAGGWSEVYPNQRLNMLWTRGASDLISGYEPVPDIAANPAVGRRLRGQPATEARTALELVQQAYRGVPFGVAGYDPQTNTVALARFTDSSAVRLARVGGKIAVSLPTGQVVPASRVGASSYTLESDAANAIDAVQVSYHYYGKDPGIRPGSTDVQRAMYTEGFIEARTNRYDARSRRVLKLETQFITFDTSLYENPGFQEQFNRFPAWLLERVTAIVNKLNGQLRVPSLTFDAKRMPLPAALEALIYRPVAPGVPLYFAGSIYNGMTAVGPQFQIIGGTLRYDNGWSHEVTVCATGPAVPSTLTIATLSSDTAATIGDFDPDVSLADLGHVSIGLTA